MPPFRARSSSSKRSRKKLIFILFSYLSTHLHSQPSFSLSEQNFAPKGRFRLACCAQWCDDVSTLCTIFSFSLVLRIPYQLCTHLAVCLWCMETRESFNPQQFSTDNSTSYDICAFQYIYENLCLFMQFLPSLESVSLFTLEQQS